MQYPVNKLGLSTMAVNIKPSEALKVHRAEILRIVERNNALNARVFGSVLHQEDTESSDLDLLVDITPTTSLLDIARIKKELAVLLGCPVDVLTPNGLSPMLRSAVLAEAKPV